MTKIAGSPARSASKEDAEPGSQLEGHRAELTAYAYRMLGSAFEAEDAVQETLLRAWRSMERFEGRSSLRTWLYRIATNVCLDMLSGSQRRAFPMDLGPAQSADTPLGAPLPEVTWLEPIPEGRVAPSGSDPGELAELRESVRLALISALQLLPPRQRAILVLREVLRWKASEVAELLNISVPAVNSALQRARASLAVRSSEPYEPLNQDQQALLNRYVDAFERYDMDSLTSLLHEEAAWSMPPYELWLQTHEDVRAWCLGPGIGCKGSRLVPLVASGSPGFAQYKPAEDGGYEPWSIQVLEVSGGKITGITFFLDTERLFPLFGMPPTP